MDNAVLGIMIIATFGVAPVIFAVWSTWDLINSIKQEEE
tara:strand:- start:236 stop:352 length:117 start_codon:yes stop_codon:yes gene_type:complete